jgi:hypothetical protein
VTRSLFEQYVLGYSMNLKWFLKANSLSGLMAICTDLPTCIQTLKSRPIRKDIDNPGATWEPCRTLTVSMSHEEDQSRRSSSIRRILHASARGRKKLRPRSNTEPWSPVMAYLPTGDRMDSTRAPASQSIPHQNPYPELGTFDAGGTQHPVHSGNHGRLCTTTVHTNANAH